VVHCFLRGAGNTDAVGIKTDRMRVLVQRQPCRITVLTHAIAPCSRRRDKASWRWRSKAASNAAATNTGGIWRTHGAARQNAGGRSIDDGRADYGSLTDEMYQAILFFIALRPEVGYGIFSTPPLETVRHATTTRNLADENARR